MKFGKARRIHLVGIGGSGMSGIAEVLLNLGYTVTGSDLAEGEAVKRLRRLGARIWIGHASGNARMSDVVVTSSAVAADNVEVREAKRLSVPIIPRAEMLAELMRMKYGVAVAGSHGKTTTTSMIAAVLDGCGLDPTIVVGGRVGSLRSNAKLGTGELMVAEADESDGSFLRLKPTLAVVTNIDREHLDHYRDLEEIQATFVAFLNRVPFYGAAFLCIDDPGIRQILPRLERRHVAYGFSSDAEYTAADEKLEGFTASYTAKRAGRTLGRVRLAVPGRHNILNSLAAIAVGMELDQPFSRIAKGLAGFTGVDRRFQLRGERDGVTVVDDYGHHPSEIVATLMAARAGIGRGPTLIVATRKAAREGTGRDADAASRPLGRPGREQDVTPRDAGNRKGARAVREATRIAGRGHAGHGAEAHGHVADGSGDAGRRLIVVFQPHRYTRTKALAPEFHAAFDLADTVILTEIYPAGEPALPGITGKALAAAIAARGHRDVRFERDMEEIPALIRRIARAGDLVLTLGAGSIGKVGRAYLEGGETPPHAPIPSSTRSPRSTKRRSRGPKR